jgi:hypothetical protein
MRRWGLSEAQKLKFNFKCNSSFINKFKREYKISGRKVEKLVTKNQIQNKDKLESDAEKFRSEIISELHNFYQNFIINTD